jgi:osmoprotectant transport system substrate-binding protein
MNVRGKFKAKRQKPLGYLIVLILFCATNWRVLYAQTEQPNEPSTIVVGSKEYTESLLLGKMLVLLLREAGYLVEDKTGYGGTGAVRAALEKGQLDVYPELTGTALALFHKLPPAALPKEAERSYELAKSLDASKGIVWLTPNRFVSDFAVVTSQEQNDLGMESLEELASALNDDQPLKLCVWDEFYGRQQDGLAALQAAYGFAFAEDNIFIADQDDTFAGLAEGRCDFAVGALTDGRIDAWNFHVLNDPRGFFPTYLSAPVIRQEVIETNPKLAEVLNPLGQHLTQPLISQLTARIDIGSDQQPASGDEENVELVAYSFLRSKRMVRPPAITIGSKDDTEQLILGKMLALLLNYAGYQVIDKSGMGDAQALRTAIKNGEIDLYMEFNGTALTSFHNLPPGALPTDAGRAHALVQGLDEKEGLVWLDRGAYNNTYAMLVRDDLWNENMQSLEALAQAINENDTGYTLCVENDFAGREAGGLGDLEEVYAMKFTLENVFLTELDRVYEGLRAGECNLAVALRTDGRTAAWGFHPLADPLAFFPVYNIAPVIRKSVLDANPELKELLNSITALLNDATMSQLNALVELGDDGEPATNDEETPENVARTFLESANLIDPVN